MKSVPNRRSILRWAALVAAAAVSACHVAGHVPPGQIRKQTTPAARGTAPGQAKKR